MNFEEISNLFEKLEKTSKRLEKILLIRDFGNKNKKDLGILFDIISGDFQRKINKRNIGISLKTIFAVISFLGNKTQNSIEKEFNKIGDVGEVSIKILEKNKHESLLNTTELTLNDIIISLNKIKDITGKDSNKIKKEILTNLFLKCQKKSEYKFLARLLIDDLRIGVSVGVLREASVNIFLPKLIGIQQVCESCGYVSLNQKKCFKCNKDLDLKNQDEISNSKFEILEVGTPKEEVGLEDYFDVRDHSEEIKFMLRNYKDNILIKTQNPRAYYNAFLEIFEKKYNLINSFEEIFIEINKDLTLILNAEIIIMNPIRSMLGTRAKNIDESFKISNKPALIDFKYDGLRVQIHNYKGKVKLFSRNLDEITKQFPEVVKYIKDNFSDLSFVVDSECVAYDFDEQKFLPFQMLSRRILTKNVDEVSHIKVIVKIFDIMYLNDKTLIDETYEHRRKEMQEMLLNRSLKQDICFELDKLKSI